MGSFARMANGARPAFGPVRPGLIDAAPSTTLGVLEPRYDTSVTDAGHGISPRKILSRVSLRSMAPALVSGHELPESHADAPP